MSGEKVCVVCRCEPAKIEDCANAMHLSKAGAAAAYRGTCAVLTTQSDNLRNLDVSIHTDWDVSSADQSEVVETR